MRIMPLRPTITLIAVILGIVAIMSMVVLMKANGNADVTHVVAGIGGAAVSCLATIAGMVLNVERMEKSKKADAVQES